MKHISVFSVNFVQHNNLGLSISKYSEISGYSIEFYNFINSVYYPNQIIVLKLKWIFIILTKF